MWRLSSGPPAWSFKRVRASWTRWSLMAAAEDRRCGRMEQSGDERLHHYLCLYLNSRSAVLALELVKAEGDVGHRQDWASDQWFLPPKVRKLFTEQIFFYLNGSWKSELFLFLIWWYQSKSFVTTRHSLWVLATQVRLIIFSVTFQTQGGMFKLNILLLPNKHFPQKAKATI